MPYIQTVFMGNTPAIDYGTTVVGPAAPLTPGLVASVDPLDIARQGRPAMGFNLHGMGLGVAAMLHLLLLAVFIVVFFWLPGLGPASTYVNTTEMAATNIGYTMLSAMQECGAKNDDDLKHSNQYYANEHNLRPERCSELKIRQGTHKV